MDTNNIYKSCLLLIFVTLISCQKDLVDSSSSDRSLYVASGLCYSGQGITTFTATTASNLIYKVDLNTGAPGDIIADYNLAEATPGSSPVSIFSKDSDSIWVVVENATAGARRIDTLTSGEDGPAYYYSNATAFSGILRKSAFDAVNGALLISKSSAIERINMTPARDLAGTNPWVNNPAGNCATTNSMITAIKILPNGNILYAHSSTTAGNRKLAIVKSSGYRVAGDCVISADVTVPSYVTDMVYLEEYGQLLVAMGESTVGNNMNSIFVYDIDPDTHTISNGVSLLENNSGAGDKYASYLYGISAMAYDSSSQSLYVAMANAVATTVQNYKIEKFNYDPVSKVLTRSGNAPWSGSWAGSKCISSMLIK